MKKRTIVLFLFLLSAIHLFSLNFSGWVRSPENEALSFASLILPVLDLIEYSDENGHFSIDLDDSVFEENNSIELIVSCDGYLDKQIFLTPETAFPLEIELKGALVEMDAITVTEQREKETNPVDSFIKEEIEKIPTGGDPLQVLAVNSGVLPGSEILDYGMGSSEIFEAAGGIPLPEFIIRGTSPFGNLYYYDYIRMPSLYHKQGFPVPSSLLPESMINQMEIVKGGYDSSVGPGYGGLVRFHSPVAIPEKGSYELSTSIANGGFSFEQPLGKTLALYGSVKKSFYDYTIQPLFDYLYKQEIIELNHDDNNGEFDYCLKALWLPTNSQSLSLDFIGLFDTQSSIPFQSWQDDFFLSETDLFGEYKYNNASWEMNDNYSVHGQGMNWNLTGDKADNELFVSHVFIDNKIENYGKMSDWFKKKFVDTSLIENRSRVRQVQAGDKAEYRFPFGLNLALGGEYDYYFLSADKKTYHCDYENLPYNEEFTLPCYDSAGLQLQDEGTVNADSFEFSSFLKASQTISRFTLFAGPRIDYFHFFEDYYLSGRGGIAYSDDDKLEIILSGGNYPGKLDYLAITRGLHTIGYLGESDANKYVPTKISKALCANLDINYQFNAKANFQSAVYFNRIFDLSAASILLHDKTPSDGLGWGIESDLAWSPVKNLDWDFHYTFAWSRYLVENEGWLCPDSEIYHSLVVQNYWKTRGPFRMGTNLRVYSGQVFTPEVITGTDPGDNYWLIEKGKYNSCVNYIPCFALDLSLKWNFPLKKGDMELFIDLTDLVSGKTIYGANDFVGQDTSKAGDRVYNVNSIFDFTSIPAADFGVKFSF